MERKEGFTLIELLVVIAIIAILASILFPVFAQAKNAAKKDVSMSNMKQIGMAAQLYFNDYDDTTPALYYFDPTDLHIPSTFGFYYWPVLFLPYTKTESVFLCPNDTYDDGVLSDGQGHGRFDRNNLFHFYILGANPSYGYNYRYLNDKVNSPDPNGTNPLPFYFKGKSATSLATLSETVLYAEATMKDLARPGGGTISNPIGYSRVEPPSRWTGTSPSATAQGQLWPRFNKDLVNVIWMDTHVKPFQIKSLKVQSTDPVVMDQWWNGLRG